MITFKDFLKEQSPMSTASAETASKTRQERIEDARLSDAALKRKKVDELNKLKKSTDPIDREIATLRNRLATLMQRKKQKEQKG